jgi:hypothetical protein
MQKRENLTTALAERPQAENKTAAPQPAPPTSEAWGTRPDRSGKSNISAYFDMPVKWELQALLLERSRSLGRRVTSQELLAEALNDLFKKYGKAEVARVGGTEP